MSTEYSPEEQSQPVYGTPTTLEPAYSPFWPLVILMTGLILWTGYQAFSAYSQSSALNSEFKAAIPTINVAQEYRSRLVALAQDLVQTSSKDPYAAQIVKEAGIQVRPNNGSTSSGH